MSKQIKNGKADEPVTKKEFNERLDKVDGRLDKVELALQNQAKALIKTDERFDLLEAKIATGTDKILSAVDGIARNVIDVERKSIVNTHRINEMESKIEEHEKRLNRIESARH